MFLLLLLPLLSLYCWQVKAQCSSPINSFPYTQDFEASNGGWTPGGTASQWSWGTPIKPVINGAASGTKCWITGTLTQSAYSNNQNSTLTSPCFDLSALTAPYISFQLFWETEKKYDGASFEYSINGGNTWQVLGDNQSCPDDNWFNTPSITALGSLGWSGNIQTSAACAGGQGGGSGRWKLARHHLNDLAGESNVRFRFRFAAGSVCNGYDGFAVDDIFIGETPALSAQFTATCAATDTWAFQPATAPCGAIFAWDFGDPASGAANQSGVATPQHRYATPGTYTVTLTVISPSGLAAVHTREVKVIGITPQVLIPLDCHGSRNGSLEVFASPAGNYQYEWNTSPAQNTPVISGLGAGTYSVRVSGNGVCPAIADLNLQEPSAFSVFLGNDTVICSGTPLTLNAGVFSAYQWQDGSGTATYTASQSGLFFVEVMNNAGCKARDSIRITLGCKELHFPTAFTPNGDGKNESFGALGDAGAVSEYRLRVFNRWGQLVFSATEPAQRWNGKIGGKLQQGSFIWMAEYRIAGVKDKVKHQGVTTLIR